MALVRPQILGIWALLLLSGPSLSSLFAVSDILQACQSYRLLTTYSPNSCGALHWYALPQSMGFISVSLVVLVTLFPGKATLRWGHPINDILPGTQGNAGSVGRPSYWLCSGQVPTIFGISRSPRFALIADANFTSLRQFRHDHLDGRAFCFSSPALSYWAACLTHASRLPVDLVSCTRGGNSLR